MTSIKINGTTYNVTETRKMDTVSGSATELTMVKPRGRGVQYVVVMWDNGRVSEVVNCRSAATERVWALEVVA